MHRVLWHIYLGLACCLLAVAGFGFMIASAFMALSAVLGAQTAALCFGLVLLVLAGLLLALSRKGASRTPATTPDQADATPAQADMAEAGSIIAFTAAFVLARYLAYDKRD